MAQPKRTTSDLQASTTNSPSISRSDRTRPSIAKVWQTERPHVASRSSVLPPRLDRGATNSSQLNRAIWSTENDESSDSDSSSDDEHHTAQNAPDNTRNTGLKEVNSYSKFKVGNEDFNTRGKVSKKDGRLNISVNETNNRGYLAKALGANFMAGLDTGTHKAPEPSTNLTTSADLPRPKLNIVVMVIGSRGDIQPFLKVGKDLKEYGHRVRIATHPAFKDFVEKDSGLEFFSIGGDPAELMAFMVKNPGMIPTMDTLKTGEVGRRREQMAAMFDGFWRACINATDDETDASNLKMLGANAPFVADAIIANPPSFAHIHCAERLGIPLHLMFTFPYTPTQAFPHPLANIKKSNVDPGYTNFMSYPLVEMMTWQGLGDLVNDFRRRKLGLEAVSTLWAPGQLYRMKVPYTYLWSPGLVPKPKDWGPEIEIAGFVFLDLASSFEPPEELVKFLNAGEPPVYIGFGSIVVDNPDTFTKMIFEAVEMAGVRALVSKGWGGLGDDNIPDNVFMLDNTPHDWLFPRVKAVVHHGGAGTTAIGLKCGKPTMVVPFFGDQQFWGSMIGEAGAGAQPVPYKNLTVEKLAEGIKQCLTEEAEVQAKKIAASIEAEGDGARNAVDSFHRSLVLEGKHSMRCSILEDRVAVWSMKHTHLRLSALAAEFLVEKRRISWKQLRLIRHNEWNDFEGPGEPLTGAGTAILGTLTGMATGVGSVPFRIARSAKKRTKAEERRRKMSEKIKPNKNGSGRGMLSAGPPDRIDQLSGITEVNEGDSQSIVGNEMSIRGEENAPDSEQLGNVFEDKATLGADMGKHTVEGEPLPHNHDPSTPENMNDVSSVIDEPKDTIAEDIVQDVGGGLGRTAEALARAPMDLSLAVAQGFHNAPRLYGDTTVRKPTRITGYKSGLKAAGEEFAYGIYDGCTGLVLQPYHGARDGGPLGFVKGVGMGVTGFVLKDLAAIFGPFGYTLKGVHKEMLKSQQPTHFIRKARIMQGQRDLKYISEEEKIKAREATEHGWTVIQQFWDLMEEKKGHGLKGRASARKERKHWIENGAFENVHIAEMALDARRKGEGLEHMLTKQREEVKQVKDPKKSAVDDIQIGSQVESYSDPKAITEFHSESNGDNGITRPRRGTTERQQTV